VIALSTSAFVLGIVTTVTVWGKALKSNTFLIAQLFTISQTSTSVAWHGLQAICESLITILLSRALLKSRSGFKRSDFVLKCIVRRVIQVGLLGTLCALAGLATWFFLRKTTIYEMFDMTVGSIYTHVIFDTLLSRVRLREHLAEGGPVDLMTSLQVQDLVHLYVRPVLNDGTPTYSYTLMHYKNREHRK